MSKLTREDILKLARLARLRLSDEEVVSYQHDLSAIIDYITILESVDTTGLEPTYQVTGLTNITRKDELIDYKITQAELLKNVPQVQDGLIKVRRMIV